jgi:hypothetical protein
VGFKIYFQNNSQRTYFPPREITISVTSFVKTKKLTYFRYFVRISQMKKKIWFCPNNIVDPLDSFFVLMTIYYINERFCSTEFLSDKIYFLIIYSCASWLFWIQIYLFTDLTAGYINLCFLFCNYNNSEIIVTAIFE